MCAKMEALVIDPSFYWHGVHTVGPDRTLGFMDISLLPKRDGVSVTPVKRKRYLLKCMSDNSGTKLWEVPQDPEMDDKTPREIANNHEDKLTLIAFLKPGQEYHVTARITPFVPRTLFRITQT